MEFTQINIEGMNETDVREAIVRPFIHALGYAYGTPNHIRTELPLRYDKAFLGRKNASKDPALRGRADYICEVISHGRWVIEVKAPDQDLTLDDAQQAHTYAAHPEVAAFYYLLTNGREFRLYRMSRPDEPELSWKLTETNDRFPVIRNILGPAAIKQRALIDVIDVRKPLAPGLKSSARIVGGHLTYSEHFSKNPQIAAGLKQFAGMRATITGKDVVRTEWGLLRAQVEILRGNALLDQLNQLASMESFVFESADEYVSTEPTKPSIFQNITGGSLDAGTTFQGIPFVPSFALPFPIEMLTYTEAVGFLDGERFRGTFMVSYDFRVPNIAVLSGQLKQLATIFQSANLGTAGEFELVWK